MTGMIPIWHWLKISNDPQPWMVSDPKRVHKMVYSHPLRETYQVSLFFLFFLFLFLGIATNHPDYPHYIPTLLLVYLSVFFFMVHNPEISQYYYPMLQKTAITIVIPWSSHDYPIIISFVFHGYPIIQFYTIIIQLYDDYTIIIQFLWLHKPHFVTHLVWGCRPRTILVGHRLSSDLEAGLMGRDGDSCEVP